jgi:hypothetical protein
MAVPVLLRVDQRRRYVGADPGRTLGLSVLTDTKTLAHARSKPSPRFGVASSPVFRSDQRGRGSYSLLILTDTKNLAHAPDRSHP